MAEHERPRVNVAFHPSGGLSLRRALKTLGREEEVVSLVDDLSFGPIDPGDVRQRMQWRSDELNLEKRPDIEEQIDELWRRLTTLRDAEVVVWISRRCVSEYCGLLELLWRVKAVPISVVDVADIDFKRDDTSMAFSWIGDKHIVEETLVERATPVSDIERKRYESEWKRLREENGPLRILTDAGVVSVPITHYDECIISCVTDEWQRCARVVGDALYRMSEGPYRQCNHVDLVFERLLTLIDSDVIEGRTDEELWDMRSSSVRRRPA